MFRHDHPRYASRCVHFWQLERLNANLAERYIRHAEIVEYNEIREQSLQNRMELERQRANYKRWKKRKIEMQEGWMKKFWLWLKY